MKCLLSSHVGVCLLWRWTRRLDHHECPERSLGLCNKVSAQIVSIDAWGTIAGVCLSLTQDNMPPNTKPPTREALGLAYSGKGKLILFIIVLSELCAFLRDPMLGKDRSFSCGRCRFALRSEARCKLSGCTALMKSKLSAGSGSENSLKMCPSWGVWRGRRCVVGGIV